MSLEATIARVSELQAQLGLRPTMPMRAVVTANEAQTINRFAPQLQQAQASAPAARVSAAAAVGTAPAAGGVGERMVSLAQSELAKGVVESPPGSNNSPDIARYRTATEGSGVGPWCAYFVSYIAKQAGVPIGDRGQGMGLVDDITAWARRTGKFFPNEGTPKPGDIALFDEHIGIVEKVMPDGRVQLIEGNSSNRLQQVMRSRGELIGFARLG